MSGQSQFEAKDSAFGGFQTHKCTFPLQKPALRDSLASINQIKLIAFSQQANTIALGLSLAILRQPRHGNLR